MGRGTSVANFLKGYDRYANPVSLLYKRKGQYQTAVGGVATIVSFAMLSYWLVLNLIQAVHPGTFEIKKVQDLTFLEANEIYYKELNIPQEKLFTAYNLVSSDDSIPADEVQNYVIGLWIQSNGKTSLKAYQPAECLGLDDLGGIIQSDLVK